MTRRDQDAVREVWFIPPHPPGSFEEVVGSLIAQARAEEREAFRKVLDRINRGRAEERERVSRVIAEVRDARPEDRLRQPVYMAGWRAACDAIEAALEKDGERG